MKSQDPDMYSDGCDFITYSAVFGYIRKKKASPCCEACQHGSVMKQEKFKGSLQISGCVCCESALKTTLYINVQWHELKRGKWYQRRIEGQVGG